MKLNILGPNDPALEVLQETLYKNPQLNMKLTIIPWEHYRERLMETLTVSSSSAQAVFIPGHIWLPELADSGYLSALEPLMESVPSEIIHAYNTADIVPEIASECLYENQQYQLPFFSDGHLLFYRSDIISLDEGLGIPVLSIEVLQALVRDHHQPPLHYGLALKADSSEILTDFLPYLWEASGEILDAEGKPCFNIPANIKALEQYCSLGQWCPPKTDTYGNAEIAEVLRRGEAVLVANWGGQTAPILLDVDNPWRSIYKTAVFSTPWNATWGIAIPSNQSEILQKQTIVNLMQLLNSEQDREITRLAGSPVRESSYASEELSRYPWLSAQREMLRRARPLPSNPKLGTYLATLYDAVHKAFTGELSSSEALQKAQDESLEQDD